MNKYRFLAVVIAIGALLRFALLGRVPIGFHRDEAFLGYNAYSILKTGRDISGNFLPLHLRSFLYSPAGYAYVSIPFIWAFGLSAFSVRFASALFGTLTIILLYLLVIEVLSQFWKEKSAREFHTIGLLSAGVFAVSPWNVNLSRTATENTVVTFFLLAGALFFLKSLKGNFVLLISAFFFFFITLFMYQSPRAFLPLMVPLVVLLCRKSMSFRHKIWSSLLYVLLIALPVTMVLRSADLSLRIRSLNIFAFPKTASMVQDWIATDGVVRAPYYLTRVFHNKVTGYLLTYTENYAEYLSYGFLFSDKGLPDRYRIPSVGLLYRFETVFLIFALVSLWTRARQVFVFVIGWIALSFSGSALTFDDIPNMQRTLMAAPMFSMLTGIGLYLAADFLMAKKKLIVWGIPIAIFILYDVGFYVMQYYSYGKLYRPWYRQDGYSALVAAVNAKLPSYTNAVITSREGAPTIFFLFYSRYDPRQFQSETRRTDTASSDHISFAGYAFTDEECPLRFDPVTKRTTGERGILYVNSGLCPPVPAGAHVIDDVRRADGSKAFQVAAMD